MAKAIPDGYTSVTPHIVVKDSKKALEHYKEAFGAETLYAMEGPGGKIVHAEFKIGNSIVMMSDEFPEMGPGPRAPQTVGGTTAGLMIYTENCDALYDRAVKAGCKALMPLQDMFWGDRYGTVEDAFGHRWSIATHKEDVPPDEMKRRHEAFKAQMAQQQKQ